MTIESKNTLTLKNGLHNPSSIDVILTAEQQTKIKSKSEKEEPLSLLGFINPNQIHSYYCNECNNVFQEHPNVEVYIRSHSFNFNPAQITYLCKQCNGKGFLYNYYLFENINQIPLEFIIYDETGDYKIPTTESIEDLFKKIEEIAKKGHGRGLNTIPYNLELNILLKWSKKIGYEINQERFNKLKQTHQQAYIEQFQKYLPELIESIKHSSYSFNLEPYDESGYNSFEMSGLAEKVGSLFEMLPHLTSISETIKTDILKILASYKDMFSEHTETLRDKKKELEEKIKLAEISEGKAESVVKDYSDKYGLTKEQTKKAREEAKNLFLDTEW